MKKPTLFIIAGIFVLLGVLLFLLRFDVSDSTLESGNQTDTEDSEELTGKNISKNSRSVKPNAEQLSRLADNQQGEGFIGLGFTEKTYGEHVQSDPQKEEQLLDQQSNNDSGTEKESNSEVKIYEVHGRVIEKETSNPITEFSLSNVENWEYDPEIPNGFVVYKEVDPEVQYSNYLIFSLKAEGYAPVFSYSDRMKKEKSSIKIELSKSGSLTGRLLYHDGKPADGFDVRYTCSNCDRNFTSKAVTNSNGVFTLAKVPNDKRLNVYFASDYLKTELSRKANLDGNSEMDMGDIYLPQVGQFTVNVANSDGSPVEGMKVQVQINCVVEIDGKRVDNYWDWLYTSRKTDENGQVVEQNVPYPSEMLVELENDMQKYTTIETSDHEVTFTISESSVSGHIKINNEDVHLLYAEVEDENGKTISRFHASNDPNHYISHEFDSTYLIEGVAPGQYTLEISAAANNAATSLRHRQEFPIEITSGGTVKQDHNFTGADLKVIVLDMSEEPVEGATIYISNYYPSDYTGVHYGGGSKMNNRQTNEDGEIIIKDLPIRQFAVRGYFDDISSKEFPTETLRSGETTEVKVLLPVNYGTKVIVKVIEDETNQPFHGIDKSHLWLMRQTSETSSRGVGELEYGDAANEFTKEEIPEGLYLVSRSRNAHGFLLAPDSLRTNQLVNDWYFEVKKDKTTEIELRVTKKSNLRLYLDVEINPENHHDYKISPTLSYIGLIGTSSIIEPDKIYLNSATYEFLNPGLYFLTVYNKEELIYSEEVEIGEGEEKQIKITVTE